jgi:hypothetical protein
MVSSIRKERVLWEHLWGRSYGAYRAVWLSAFDAGAVSAAPSGDGASAGAGAVLHCWGQCCWCQC